MESGIPTRLIVPIPLQTYCTLDMCALCLSPRILYRPTMISLTLLYASVLPLCLHVVLLIWPAPNTPFSPTSTTTSSTTFFYLPTPLIHLFTHLTPHLPPILIEQDSNWISTHLLSGMSSGLALRVLLPTKPAGTMGAVLGGWAVRGLVVHWVEGMWG